MYLERRPDHELEELRHGARYRRGKHEDFFGLEVEKMSPRAQVKTATTVLALILAGAILVFSQIPEFFWLIFVFGWMIFPTFGLLVKGIAGFSEGKTELPETSSKERELLEALREHGELTPARAAMETSLTVVEADRMLKELAEGGHLDVRVRGGGLFYALWEPDGEGVRQEIEGRD